MQLPFFKTDNKELSLLQTKWRSILNPFLKNPMNGLSVLKDVPLILGETKVPHLLGRQQQGWVILDVDDAADIYRSQPLNASFLYLNSSAAVTVSIGVF